MTGIIVTGHGLFAAGMTSAISLIAGEQKNWVAVNFEAETDQLEKDLAAATDTLKECEGILIFCDLAGGSPFKTAVLQNAHKENVEIIAGTSLPMLAETALARTMGLDVHTLAGMAVQTGKDQALLFDMAMITPAQEEEIEEMDGI